MGEEFISLTENHLNMSEGTLSDLFYPLIQKDMNTFFTQYQQILLTIPSYYDVKDENSLHMLLLGMSIYLKNDYEIFSNKEVGYGRADIVLKKKKEEFPNIVIELKYSKRADVVLQELAKTALKQIKVNHYTAPLHGEAICIGLAHAENQAYMEFEEILIS